MTTTPTPPSTKTKPGWTLACALVTTLTLVLVTAANLAPKAWIGAPSARWLRLVRSTGLPHAASDKAGHFCAFLLLGLLCSTGLASARRFHWRSALATSLSLLALGGALELLQFAVPHRTVSWADFGANSLGALFGLGVPLLAALPFTPAPQTYGDTADQV